MPRRPTRTPTARAELNSGLLSSFSWRSIGPAVASGRIADIAIDPTDRSTWYVAASSGNVWKTTNAGTTWTPIFDDYGSYSIGAIALDPNDHLTLWVGSGENNGQRSVGYGDGVYKSVDGGRSFTNMGLETSAHIGMIAVHPDDSRTVFVAAQGPLWNAGGERGLYRTRGGGESWELVLEIDEHTGVNEVYFDPRNPEVMYASSWQRRRHQWTMIDGGPGSGIHKSTDGGETWRAINRGLPSGDKGRIGMAISPINPDVLYAIVEASGNEGGTFRSENMGENWSRTSRYQSSAPMYYHELYADPHRFDRIYSLDTFLEMSDDGGKNWSRLPTQSVHVDHHALAFDPDDPEHLILGNDGGLYETFDFGENWSHFANLPLTQYYKVATSNDEPFYYVYGGTQDNNTMGGPSQTLGGGIRNSDWYVTLGGDGFDPVVDPENPDIIYSQLQHGVLSRFDRGSKERLDIQPQADPGGPPLRWYWDAGLIMSPHDNHRLYFGAQILFRSDDQGSSWRAISGDLSRNIDRNQLEVMGRVWSVDAVGKNRSTSVFGHIVAISESPLVEGLIYVGTDDGLVQVTEDGGETWREIASLPGVPDTSFVHDVEASLHDPDAVFAVVNNFKRGDFRPYVLKSEDRGRSWTAITGGLPDNSPSFSIVQDHVEPDLLFLGAEFGAFVSVDGGESWMEFDSGLPTIPVRDLEIQQREGDLVAATFGRSFYVVDDYTPLRELARGSEPIIASAGHLFEVADGEMYVPWNPGGANGADFYAADNPELGVTFTYWVGETMRTRRAERRAAERRAAGRGEDTPYPSWEELREEDREEAPRVFLTVRDEGGEVVNVVNGSTSRGVHRAAWNYRYPAFTPVTGGGGGGGFGGFGGGNGPMALPGSYTVSLAQRGGRRGDRAGRSRLLRDRPDHHAGHRRPGPGDRARLPARDRRAAARRYRFAARRRGGRPADRRRQAGARALAGRAGRPHGGGARPGAPPARPARGARWFTHAGIARRARSAGDRRSGQPGRARALERHPRPHRHPPGAVPRRARGVQRHVPRAAAAGGDRPARAGRAAGGGGGAVDDGARAPELAAGGLARTHGLEAPGRQVRSAEGRGPLQPAGRRPGAPVIRRAGRPAAVSRSAAGCPNRAS